jgi:GntR family transcriptional regulator
MKTTLLNPQSPIPLYRQLADFLADRIRTGEYTPGSRIPSEPQLAAAHGIGRPTARQAIDLLVRKGLLTRRRGSGTYVCEPQQEVDLFSLEGTGASFTKQGVTVDIRMLAPVSLSRIDGEPDNPFDGHRAYFFSRLTMADHVPVLIEDMYLHADLFAGIDRMDLTGRSLSEVAESHYHLRPTGGKQRFSIGYAQNERAGHLSVSEDTPLLLVQRYLHFPQKNDGVYCRLWCRSDQFVYSQTIGGAVYA